MSDWKPGDLAVATVRGEPNVRIMRTDAVWTGQPVDGWYTHRHGHVTDLRRLYVLDFGDIDPRNFVDVIRFAGYSALADQLEAQLPPVPEPTGLPAGLPGDSLGVVCDRCGAELFRAQVWGWGPEGERLLAYSEEELRAAEKWHRCPEHAEAERLRREVTYQTNTRKAFEGALERQTKRTEKAEAEVERLLSQAKCICVPWHPDCDGPQEDCPKHGRTYSEVWEIVTRLTDERDQLRESVLSLASEMTKKTCDGDRASGYQRLVTVEVLQSAWERLGGWE